MPIAARTAFEDDRQLARGVGLGSGEVHDRRFERPACRGHHVEGRHALRLRAADVDQPTAGLFLFIFREVAADGVGLAGFQSGDDVGRVVGLSLALVDDRRCGVGDARGVDRLRGDVHARVAGEIPRREGVGPHHADAVVASIAHEEFVPHFRQAAEHVHTLRLVEGIDREIERLGGGRSAEHVRLPEMAIGDRVGMAAVARDRSLAAEAAAKRLVAVAEALHDAAVAIELDRLAAAFVPESVRVAGAVGGGPEAADVVGDVPVGAVAAERIAHPAGAVIESWRADPDLVECRRGRILARAAGDEEADFERPLGRELAAAGVSQRAPELPVRRL